MNFLVPTGINQNVKSLLSKMGTNVKPFFVDVKPEGFAIKDACFPNVRKAIEKFGGQMIIGWQIWESPFIIEAEYHAIWANKSSLIDITPKKIPISQILFVRNESQLYDGKIVDNFRLNLTKNTVVDDLIALYEMDYRIKNYKDRAYSTKVELNSNEMQALGLISELVHNLTIFCCIGNDQNSSCFCGSQKTYHECHRQEIAFLFDQILKVYP